MHSKNNLPTIIIFSIFVRNRKKMLTKSKVKNQIDKFPENFTLDELIDRLILLDKVETGNEQSSDGTIISEEDLDKEITKWFD
jgi:hypothetical protein